MGMTRLRNRARSRTNAMVDAAVVAGTIASAWLLVLHGRAMVGLLGNDALVYWSVDADAPYADATVGGAGAYLYSPAFMQALTPLRILPAEPFLAIWWTIITVTAVLLARPWPLMLLPLALPVLQDVMIGNIHVLLGAAIVIGFRWPAAWAFVLLTKVTPGIGLVWFLVRREWVALAIALGATIVIAAASFALTPGHWADWLAVLRRDGGGQSTSLLVRAAAGTGLVAWGAATSRPWTVPIGAMVALPVIWSDSFAMLLGAAYLRARARYTPETS